MKKREYKKVQNSIAQVVFSRANFHLGRKEYSKITKNAYKQRTLQNTSTLNVGQNNKKNE